MSAPDRGCVSCAEDCPGGCPASRRPCGCHCDCVWIHDACCWCGAAVGEDGELRAPDPDRGESVIARLDPATRAALALVAPGDVRRDAWATAAPVRDALRDLGVDGAVVYPEGPRGALVYLPPPPAPWGPLWARHSGLTDWNRCEAAARDVADLLRPRLPGLRVHPTARGIRVRAVPLG